MFGGGVFTFEIGPEKQQFIIHKAPVENHSSVLSAMMNNGRMQESTSGLAKLEDVSPRTFALFAEYIYTGMYRVKPPQLNEQQREYVVICRACDQHTSIKSTVSMLPKTCPDCWSIFVTIEDVMDDDRIVWSHSPKSNEAQARKRQPAHLRLSAYTYADMPFTTAPLPTFAETTFKNLTFPGLGRSHEVLKQYLATLQPADFPTESVYVHAELYVFAEKYMIDSLRDLCLHKLHRDLCEFKLSPNNVGEIEQLLIYTYDNTAAPKVHDDDFEKFSLAAPGGPAVGHHDLRNLVMTYAVAHAKKLISFPSFEEMLYGGGELVCDFARGMARRLVD